MGDLFAINHLLSTNLARINNNIDKIPEILYHSIIKKIILTKPLVYWCMKTEGSLITSLAKKSTVKQLILKTWAET